VGRQKALSSQGGTKENPQLKKKAIVSFDGRKGEGIPHVVKKKSVSTAAVGRNYLPKRLTNKTLYPKRGRGRELGNSHRTLHQGEKFKRKTFFSVPAKAHLRSGEERRGPPVRGRKDGKRT